MSRPVILFTDFGVAGPYVGQLKAALLNHAHAGPVVDLLADAPAFDARASSILLDALVPHMPGDAVMLCVVDPGVGTDRLPVVLDLDGRLFVGPDNGLFEPVSRRAAKAAAWRIDWRPSALTATFHGRDLFAPVAARLAGGTPPVQAGCTPIDLPRRPDWPVRSAGIIYCDPYGNAFTGLSAHGVGEGAVLRVGGRDLTRARTYGDLAPGTAFWYENSLGLVEIAVAGGNAARLLRISIGDPVELLENPDAVPRENG